MENRKSSEGLLPREVDFEADIQDLYSVFSDNQESPTSTDIMMLVKTQFDFRAGRSREETIWEEGKEFSQEQKYAIVDIAHKWGMLETTFPTKPFDLIVILGAHNSTLALRINHATRIQEEFSQSSSHFILLSCFRPLHSKEDLDLNEIDNETALGISLLENNLHDKFNITTASGWDDLPDDIEKNPHEHGVATTGKIGDNDILVISGSAPGYFHRATTSSTLESLKTYLDETDLRLLFVTTSLHLPYQKIQIDQILPNIDKEVVGIRYESLQNLTIDSPDSKFRIILQEIGATIENYLKEDQN